MSELSLIALLLTCFTAAVAAVLAIDWAFWAAVVWARRRNATLHEKAVRGLLTEFERQYIMTYGFGASICLAWSPKDSEAWDLAFAYQALTNPYPKGGRKCLT